MARPSVKRRTKTKQNDTVDLLDALAARLASLGKRKWKTKDLAAALEKAGSVEDEAVKANIQENLQLYAQQLHDKLVQAAPDEQAPKPQAAKRTKRGTKAIAAAAPDADAALPPSLATTEGYRQLVAAAAECRPDARFTTASLLLARKLPGERLVAAHVQHLMPETSDPDQQQQWVEALVQEATAALGVCSALAAEAAIADDALRMFAPAVASLSNALQQLTQQQPDAASQATVAVPPELTQLAARTLAAMHAALQKQRLSLRSKGAASPCFWRSQQQQQHAVDAAEAACSVSAAICTLCTTHRLLSSSSQAVAPLARQGRQQIEALALAAVADLRLLSPYAVSGQLAHLASMPLEEAQGSNRSARQFLVLYTAAAQLEVTGEQDYLACLAAARKAAAVAEHLQDSALAACILDQASRLPVSQGLLGWLQEQPPSGIVSAALVASRKGLDALSAHLIHDCIERGLQALLTAMQRGGIAVVEAPGGAAGGEAAAAGQEGGLDDLLFFADKEGDASVFGRDWHAGADSEEDEEEGEGQERVGLQLEQLPGSEGRLSFELGSD